MCLLLLVRSNAVIPQVYQEFRIKIGQTDYCRQRRAVVLFLRKLCC